MGLFGWLRERKQKREWLQCLIDKTQNGELVWEGRGREEYTVTCGDATLRCKEGFSEYGSWYHRLYVEVEGKLVTYYTDALVEKLFNTINVVKKWGSEERKQQLTREAHEAFCKTGKDG